MQRLVDRRQAHGGGLGPRCAHRRDAAGGVREQRQRCHQHREGAGEQRHARHGVPSRRSDRRDHGPADCHADRDASQLGRSAVEAGKYEGEGDGAGDQRRAALTHQRLRPRDRPQQQREPAHQDQLPAVAVHPELVGRRVSGRLDQRPQAAAGPGGRRQDTGHPGQDVGAEPAPERAQSGQGEHGHEPDQVDRGDGVRRPVDGRQDQGEPGGATSCGTTSRPGRSGSATGRRPGPGARDRRGGAGSSRVSSPNQPALSAPTTSSTRSPSATVVSASAATRRPRRPQHGAAGTGGGGQADEDGGPATDAEPGPGDRQEDHGGDQQAGRAEPEQDLRDRRALEAPSRGRPGGRRASAGGPGRREGRRRRRRGRCDGGQRDGGGAQPVEQVVGLAQRAEQLGGEEAPERERAGRAAERRGGQRAAAVGADGWCRRSAVGWRSYPHCARARPHERRSTQPVVSIRAQEPLPSTRAMSARNTALTRRPARVLHLGRHRDRGPGAGEYAILSIGACLVEDPETTFYVELIPEHTAATSEALAVTGLSIEDADVTGRAARAWR